MGRAHEVRAASMAKTAAIKSKLYSRFGKELYMAAKAGVPDPEMNQGLKRKIAEAKSNQVPADVIKRAIEKAKGGTDESYDACRYEGFGPGASTIIVDCLTDNVNRTITQVKTAFNKCHCKVGVSGSVSHSYKEVGFLSLKYDDEEKMLDALIEGEVDVQDLDLEDGVMTITTAFQDFAKAQEAIAKLIPEVEYDVCEVTMLPDDYVTLDNDEDKETYQRLITTLEDCEDVSKVYSNVE